MRITAGKHRSRFLESLNGDVTRPTSDKIKEAVFSSIGPFFEGGSMLDVFGGSGAIALEAISRGMNKAYVIDNNFAAIQVIKKNVAALKEEKNVEVIKGHYSSVLKRLSDMKFDLVYLDPPYAMDVYDEIIEFLVNEEMLNVNCILICESKSDLALKDQYGSLKKTKEKDYRSTKITYFKGE
ncbi:16S rRNA (guanine(966)-N(2))-methyltransferase RsmD [Breznakia pachnodae]|uniref:16S rRNA (Guanine966-N2)-methyltransferase n=1 Tax=Breznakia pachnodae TaxID=265178 RepID=A0ABU0DXE5_9FIRM|nr:16S rRNA (guanine(966)-N(2))-methyltransferase RsmD [Breznakia pachnodae]MDQ0359308.1 16S rRNA (guanine966-N2)-methyltransferase [Breznakia pachnodae]